MRVLAAVGVLGVGAACQAQDAMFALTDFLFPQVVELDRNTGAVLSSVFVTGHEALFGGLAGGAGNDLYSIDGYNDGNPDRTFRIDRTTGVGTVVGPTGENWNFRTVCMHPVSGVLFGATDNRLYTIDKGSGAVTLVGNVIAAANLDQLTALAINAQGQAFVTDIQDTSLFSLDLATGQATFIAPIGQSGNWFEDLAFDETGTLWGVRQQGGVYTIDTATGAQTFRFGGLYRGLVFVGDSCYPDCNQSGTVTIADFGCFQGAFAGGNMYADCNNSGTLTIADFGCFQGAFAGGCAP
jgi:hypothetical protein